MGRALVLARRVVRTGADLVGEVACPRSLHDGASRVQKRRAARLGMDVTSTDRAFEAESTVDLRAAHEPVVEAVDEGVDELAGLPVERRLHAVEYLVEV